VNKMKKQEKVLAIGDNCVDIYLKEKTFYATGNAVDFAINLKKQDIDVSLITVFSNDIFGEFIKKTLQENGVDISNSYNKDEPTAMAKMKLINNDRFHESFYENVLADFKLPGSISKIIENSSIIYSEKRSKIYRYLDSIYNQNKIWIHDFSKRLDDELNDKILPYMNYSFFSYEKKDERIKEFLKITQSKTKNGVVIAMLGEDGSLAYDGNSFTYEKAKTSHIVNTVGAGDSYISGFISGIYNDRSLQECMEIGTNIASETISKFEPY